MATVLSVDLRSQVAAAFEGTRRGERLRAAVPDGQTMTTFVAGLPSSGMVSPMVLDGSINGQAF
jgi:hypothetical protein